jgi:hypothetical protein
MTTTMTRPMLGGTASMLGDPEAHRTGDASESSPRLPVPCAGGGLEWVPADEQAVVPLIQREMCLRCPARTWCLATALDTRSQGYWAGTTTAQRRSLRGGVGVVVADTRREPQPPTHLPGHGSLLVYRRDRCRCPECRRHNADARLLERGGARRGPGGVAA